MQENYQENETYNRGICRKCGEKYIDTSESINSILCTECRQDGPMSI